MHLLSIYLFPSHPTPSYCIDRAVLVSPGVLARTLSVLASVVGTPFGRLALLSLHALPTFPQPAALLPPPSLLPPPRPGPARGDGVPAVSRGSSDGATGKLSPPGPPAPLPAFHPLRLPPPPPIDALEASLPALAEWRAALLRRFRPRARKPTRPSAGSGVTSGSTSASIGAGSAKTAGAGAGSGAETATGNTGGSTARGSRTVAGTGEGPKGDATRSGVGAVENGSADDGSDLDEVYDAAARAAVDAAPFPLGIALNLLPAKPGSADAGGAPDAARATPLGAVSTSARAGIALGRVDGGGGGVEGRSPEAKEDGEELNPAVWPLHRIGLSERTACTGEMRAIT